MKPLKNISVSILLTALLALTFSACDLLNTEKELSAEDAKMELRAAGEDMRYNLTEMMETPPMLSLMMLGQLMGVEIGDMKSMPATTEQARGSGLLSSFFSRASLRDNAMLPGASRVIRLISAMHAQKNDGDMNGVYHYNFLTEEFDLVNENVNYLELHFPADEEAFDDGLLNCVLRIENLEMTQVVYDADFPEDFDEVPTKADVRMTIDNQVVMTMTYRATLNDSGLPSSTSITLNMAPYTITLTLSGSGTNLTTTMSMKQNNTTLVAADLDIRYTDDEEFIEKLNGFVTLSPLRFEGEMKPEEMEYCEDVDCMNKNMKVDVKQTELDKKIGKLEFRMVYDDYYEEEYPELVIVYKDGSYELLSEILAEFQE